MSKLTKLKIGEFSKMMQVTVKTLRHYEQKGLLLPSEVDEWTGYRYYNIAQMQRLNTIRGLQRQGFTLEEIKELLEDDTQMPSIDLLTQKIVETEQQLHLLMDATELQGCKLRVAFSAKILPTAYRRTEIERNPQLATRYFGYIYISRGLSTNISMF